MKKCLFLWLLTLSAITVKAQFVNIPDSNLRNWLNANGFVSCMNGNLLDTTCNLVINAISINCNNSSIQNLDGIQYFDSLKTLLCKNNNIIFLPVLPSKLIRLDCSYNNLTSIPNLPVSLKVLECSNNYLNIIPSLPPYLTKFYCGANSLTLLPILPSTIDSLYCDDNQLTSLPPLPSSLHHLWCSQNQLTSLPTLPAGLYNLQCSSNQLTSLPTLPSSVFLLVCHFNKLSSLPALPASLTSLQASNNLLTYLPILPLGLGVLFCNNNLLTSLPTIPPSLNYWLNCGNNPLTSIPDLPDSINILDISNLSVLICFPRYKKINSLNWSNTSITCLPNIGYIGTSSPPINTLPICPQPLTIISPSGPIKICSGDSVSLNTNSGLGYLYKWKLNGVVINGATSPSYWATKTGNYTVEVTYNCGFEESSPVTLTVKSLPSATVSPNGIIPLCSGESTLLNVPAGTNKIYQWKKNGTTIPGAIFSSYTASTSGTYKVIVTNILTGCSKKSGTGTVVNVYSSPTATITPQGPTTFCAGDSVELKTASNSNYSYQWKRNNTNIAGAESNKYRAKTAGSYKVKVTNTNGCTVISSAISISVPCREANEGINGGQSMQVSVSPNPSTGEFNFELVNSENEKSIITVFDFMGRIVVNESKAGTKFSINCLKLNEGIYSAMVCNGEHKEIVKLVKANRE